MGASGRRHYSVNAFALGLVVGGLISATACLVLGAIPSALTPEKGRWSVLALVTMAFVGREIGLLRFPVPENRRLVPETVFRLGHFFGPLQFGIEMGTGARTYVTSNLPYVLAAAVVLVADTWSGLLAGVGFGVGRALMAWSATSQIDTARWHASWIASDRWTRAILFAIFLALLSAIGVAATT